MKTHRYISTMVSGRCPRGFRRRFPIGLAIVLLFAGVASSQSTVNLGAASAFGVLSAAGISGTATVAGDVGTTTGTIAPGVTATGTVYPVGDAAVDLAHGSLLTAYNDAATRAGAVILSATTFELASSNLTPGVYQIGTAASLTGVLILNGTGVYIFQIGSTLITAPGSSISLIGGAQWSDIFWQVGSSATLGSTSTFEGSILANTSITANNSAIVHGRLLGGAVTASGVVSLDNNTALPVELHAFTVETDRWNAVVRWSTKTEVSNHGFDVERGSVDSKAMQYSGIQIPQWQKIGFVQGAGTSNSAREYGYIDRALSPGRYAYRLRQIDRDGTFEYFGNEEVEIGQAPKVLTLSENYPNPFHAGTTIEFSVARTDRAVLKVFNIIGKEVATLFDGNAEAGRLYQARTDGFLTAPGMYYVRLESNGQTRMRKIMSLR